VGATASRLPQQLQLHSTVDLSLRQSRVLMRRALEASLQKQAAPGRSGCGRRRACRRPGGRAPAASTPGCGCPRSWTGCTRPATARSPRTRCAPANVVFFLKSECVCTPHDRCASARQDTARSQQARCLPLPQCIQVTLSPLCEQTKTSLIEPSLQTAMAGQCCSCSTGIHLVGAEARAR